MSQRYRYSMWDGTQEVPEFTADDILDNLTDDLMNFGDLEHALGMLAAEKTERMKIIMTHA